jgi:hypothetical protein
MKPFVKRVERNQGHRLLALQQQQLDLDFTPALFVPQALAPLSMLAPGSTI